MGAIDALQALSSGPKQVFLCVGAKGDKYELCGDIEFYSHRNDDVGIITVTEQELLSKYINSAKNIVDYNKKKAIVNFAGISKYRLGGFRMMKDRIGKAKAILKLKDGYDINKVKRVFDGILANYAYDCYVIGGKCSVVTASSIVKLITEKRRNDIDLFYNITKVCDASKILECCKEIDSVMLHKVGAAKEVAFSFVQETICSLALERACFAPCKLSDEHARLVYDAITDAGVEKVYNSVVETYKIFVAYAIDMREQPKWNAVVKDINTRVAEGLRTKGWASSIEDVAHSDDYYRKLCYELREKAFSSYGEDEMTVRFMYEWAEHIVKSYTLCGTMGADGHIGSIVLDIWCDLSTITKEEVLKLGEIVGYVGGSAGARASGTCIRKFRDRNNRIVGYSIKDRNGYVRELDSKTLKNLIRQKWVTVDNLTLTSDNRLVDTSTDR